MANIDIDRVANATAYDPSGDKIGKVGQVYLDDQTSEPTLVSVKTGFFGSSETLVPLDGSRFDGDDLVVAYEESVVKDAPRVEADRHISESEQDELYRYYEGARRGVGGQADAGADERARVDRDTARRDVDDQTAVTRSEERLNVGKESVEAGRARLRKYVTTEDQTVTVPTKKEKVVVEREPIEGNAPVGRIGTEGAEEVEEIVVREERPVVDKETVGVEQVRLGKETVTDQETVSGEVRKEHIEVEGENVAGEGRRNRRDR